MNGGNEDHLDEVEDSNDIPIPRPVRLSLHLIVKRHLPPQAQSWDQDKILDALNKITHLRLDRENIGEIDGLEILGQSVQNVYLQRNRITKIQNLDCLKNIQFITLAGNNISVVENLSSLHKLLFLDLSENNIEDFDIDEFPQSLLILNLKDNPCTQLQDYRGRIIQDLANLKQLDEIDISRQEKLEAGFAVSSDEEEEEEDEPEGAIHDKLTDLRAQVSNILLRSQKRVEQNLLLHQLHESQLDDIREESALLSSSRNNPPNPP